MVLVLATYTIRPNPARNPAASDSGSERDHAKPPMPTPAETRHTSRLRRRSQRLSRRVISTADSSDPTPNADTSQPYAVASALRMSRA